jgi:hypothetical protein
VVEIGQGVSGFKPGDRVMCSGMGAYAEYAVTDIGRVMHIPDPSMTWEQAATLPVALQTMHNALITAGRMKRGESVLIQGASSGVGLMALKIARLMGAVTVIGTCVNIPAGLLIDTDADAVGDITLDELMDPSLYSPLGGTIILTGVAAIDGPYLKVRDVEAFRRVAGRSAALGYDGKWVLHPDQIAAGNEIFSPAQQEYDHAELILEAYAWHTSKAGGARGAVMLSDEMIDEASRKMALVVAAKGRAAGMARLAPPFVPPA